MKKSKRIIVDPRTMYKNRHPHDLVYFLMSLRSWAIMHKVLIFLKRLKRQVPGKGITFLTVLPPFLLPYRIPWLPRPSMSMVPLLVCHQGKLRISNMKKRYQFHLLWLWTVSGQPLICKPLFLHPAANKNLPQHRLSF